MERKTRVRVSLLVAVVIGLALGIAYQLADIQIVRAEAFRNEADSQHAGSESQLAWRGAILDRRGRELAVTVNRYALYANPQQVPDVDEAARRLAPIVEMSAADIRRKIEGTDRKHYRIAHSLEPEVVRRLSTMDLFRDEPPAFEFEPEYERSYPHDRLASHVIGFAGTGLEGRTGIERVRNNELLGTPARLHKIVDGLQNPIFSEILPPERPHHDVVLTLDLVLQHLVERNLDIAMRETHAVAASAVMLDPKTGEILALANRPAPRLSAFGSSSLDAQRNRAAYDAYEPGSTFKVFTAAALLENGLVRTDSWFDCENRTWRYLGQTVEDHKSLGSLSFRDVIAQSSNIGMVKASMGAPGDLLLEAYRRFGFGERTGMQLSETAGGFADLASNEVDKAWATFGYGVRVTALQLASAIGAIANDGVRVPPTIVRGMRDPDGDWEPEPARQPVRVVSAATARTVTSLLERVVERGTGRKAEVPGYRVAGKTGTTMRHVEGVGYVDGRYWTSFAGFAPSDDARIALVVVLDSPHEPNDTGGKAAAPVFARITSEVMAYLRVPTNGSNVVVLPAPRDRDSGGVRPAVVPGAGR